MAIFHLSVKVISRSSGRSAVAAAAYRGAERLHDERLDRDHDFTNKDGVVHSEVMLPEGAPEEFADREKLWNAVEAAEKRKDAQLAREVEFAIPRELTKEQGIELAREFAEAEFVEKGMIADLNVHWDIGADGQPKPHAHVMLTMREVGKDGFGAKVRDWNKAELSSSGASAGPIMSISAWPNSISTRGSITAAWRRRALRWSRRTRSAPPHRAWVCAGWRPNASRNTAPSRSAMASGSSPIPAVALDAITHQQATFTPRDLAMFVHRHSDGKEQFDLA
jgi:hypothetical protein